PVDRGTTASITVADVPMPRSAPQAKVGARPEEPSFADRLAKFFKPGTSDQPAPARLATAEPTAAPEPQPAKPGGVLNRNFSNGARATEARAPEAAPPKEGVTAR